MRGRYQTHFRNSEVSYIDKLIAWVISNIAKFQKKIGDIDV